MRLLTPYTWPASQLGEALDAVMRRSEPLLDREAPPSGAQRAAALDAYVHEVAGRRGVEVEPVASSYSEIEPTLRAAAPALVRILVAGEPRFLVLVRGGRHLRALGPDRSVHRLDPVTVRTALCAPLEAPVAPDVDRLLDEAGLPVTDRIRAALLRERLGEERVEGLWVLRLPPSAPFLEQVRQAGLVHRLGRLVAVHALQYGLWLLAWWAIGRAALQGRFDDGWLLAWMLLLLTLVPLRLLVTWWQGDLSIHAGGLLKRRLLVGTLNLRIETVRRQGIGQLLGRVIESNAVEALALSGGFLGGVAIVELGMAAGVLVLGAGGILQALALAGWTGVAALLGRRMYRRQAAWTAERLTLTHRLVERMVGHRTRLVQQAQDGRYAGEDREVAHYLDGARAMDRSAALLLAVVPRGWLVAGFAALVPAFAGAPPTAALAVSLGGMLLAYQAFQRLAMGLADLTGAAIAWRQVEELFHAAGGGTQESLPAPPIRAPHRPPNRGETVLEAHGLTFRYAPEGAPVLEATQLEVRAHDRLLLTGPSGSGKSTLASLLTGLRRPEAGLLLLRGFDRHTLGREGWRRRVVAAPQFHENHVLTGTFAFNLLMGRRWPPTHDDLRRADQICRDLGLGGLLDRMPGGLLQMVGETGWQLSHGEKSRLYLARALLQEAEFVILDESFGALDPENRAAALQSALQHAPTLLVIAHP